MTVWVDGDSVPRDIRRILLQRKELTGENQNRSQSQALRFITTVRLPDVPLPYITKVSPGPDAADTFIEEHAKAGDVVITRDIPFMDRLAEKGILALNDRGELITKENSAERRSLRDASLALRNLGVLPDSPKGSHRTAADTKRFADSLDRLLAQLLK